MSALFGGDAPAPQPIPIPEPPKATPMVDAAEIAREARRKAAKRQQRGSAAANNLYEKGAPSTVLSDLGKSDVMGV